MSAIRKLFLKHLAPTSPSPMGLEIVEARGLYLKSASGKKYMDLISGISVSALGHHHPAIQRAVVKQLKKFTHLMVYGEMIQSPQVMFAQRLAGLLPENLQSVYLVNSGSEAVEGALKLAKRLTGRTEMISCKNAYHGSSHGALSMMGDESYKQRFRPLLPGVRHIRFNVLEDLEQISRQTASVIIEPVQGEAGAISPVPGYLKALRKKCDETGTLLIFDEVQTAPGRTGSMFAFEQEEVIPDILVLAKGIGGGLPLGAFVASREMMEAFTHNPVLGHITTFGGHPLSCAAGNMCLKLIQEKDLANQARVHEQMIRERLRHSLLKGISGRGLLLALQFENAEINFAVIRHALELGLVTDWFLFNDRCLRLAPPLIIDEKSLKKACDMLLKAMELARAELGL